MKELECEILPARLASKITKTEKCWNWSASIRKDGYATAWDSNLKKPKLAHRLIYEILVCRIPEGLTLDHLCRNRSCVNPSHLEPVSIKENILRGESPAARKHRQTVCIKGHSLELSALGYRKCKICITAYHRSDEKKQKSHERNREWRMKNKEYDRERHRAWRAKKRERMGV
jgi:hypothetical protein